MKNTYESYCMRLKDKSIKQLKEIYKRKYGKDLLRGNKDHMIHTLAHALHMPRQFGYISGRYS